MMTRCLLLMVSAVNAAAPPEPYGPVPTPQQLAWQDMEYGMFCHFGINTFHNEEWTDGTKDPTTFNPTAFDARQWVAVAREVGIQYLVVTAKHHDGFCLFPSAHTDYGVVSSPWRDGKGDAVKEVADACREGGIVFGFYLSPWDRHEPRYADPPAYDVHFRNQLTELLTNYGPVGEVWFDGAGSKGHTYDWASYYALIRERQPNALIAICGPDIRWVGNEDGLAPETLWNIEGEGDGAVWKPAECDVPIRGSHWFFHTNDEKSLRDIRGLLDIYYRSVGNGATLLLNVSPDRRGLLPDSDVARLRELWSIVSDTYKTNLALGKAVEASNVRGGDPVFAPAKMLDGDPDTYWATDDGVTEASVVVDLGGPVTFNRALIQEHIALGQRVEAYGIEYWDGTGWREAVAGTTIGHKRLHRFEDITASKVRLAIKQAKACPTIRAFGLYRATLEP
ncbi:MAG TPA: alpha-L-fucosidase [Candidatus Hydrogenedentes bacterium]|nr:alpha-L-fucosidase [Candidatus Hydrogenedentota bacterium]HPG67357.1 alpha-L-fucosidase [Candidatus Hydrogenedentota bacterium]